VWLLGGLVWISLNGGAAAVVVTCEASVLWLFLLWNRLKACWAFRISGGYAFTFPLGALVFTAMMVVSAYNVISGRGVTWKGRRYQ
jgi:hypothetical protein